MNLLPTITDMLFLGAGVVAGGFASRAIRARIARRRAAKNAND